jgi:hypothetical protein
VYACVRLNIVLNLTVHASLLINRLQWFEVLDGLLGKHWRNVGLVFNCTFLLFGSVIQLIACARYHALLHALMDVVLWLFVSTS